MQMSLTELLNGTGYTEIYGTIKTVTQFCGCYGTVKIYKLKLTAL